MPMSPQPHDRDLDAYAVNDAEHIRALAGDDPLLPPIGVLSQNERLFRVNWLSALERSPSQAPALPPEFVAGLGRAVHLIDIREASELHGALGHIPGSEWVPLAECEAAVARLHRDEPIVLIARGDERSLALAKKLEARHRLVAALRGGLLAWRSQGYATSRDHALLQRRGQLRTLPTLTVHEGHLSLDDVKAHIGDPFATRMMKLSAMLLHGRLSCVDGRDDTGVIGTPGGDAGEFMLALSALERVSGRALNDVEVGKLLRRRLDTFGRFYVHTDISAGNATVKAFRADPRFDDALRAVSETHHWRRFLTSPPPALRPAMLDVMMSDPAHIGCGHLRLQWQNAETYGTRPLLVESFLRLFFSMRWNGAVEADFVALGGGHKEGAVINVIVDGGVHSFSTIPLVSPSTGAQQMFVNHPQVASFLRHELVEFLALQSDVVALDAAHKAALHAEVEALGGQQLGQTLQRLAKGLPIYTVTFRRDGAVDVEAAGHVGA